MEITLFVTLFASYLIGAIPCGVVLTRLTGAGDVRNSGSGNIGATNVYRTAGRKLGVLTLIGDIIKGVLPVAYAIHVATMPPEQTALVACATFLGHLYPVYLGFKGGKGVATALGIYLVLSPLSVAVAAVVFIGLVWTWRYVSLGSVGAAALVPILIYTFEGSMPLLAASLFISVMVIWRHHENIGRLFSGTENKFKA
ncbi:MAG: acyl-phosphate glycerol 3-phosphate acyltransferase [Desulfuromonas sp.]|nr:MAG: acyl-phosphate glycerol 3-phosphate acyltransferase [Desulfuromonas sp.]